MTLVLRPNSTGLSGANSPVEAASTRSAKLKSWRVIHACEYAREILPVVEAQLAAEMRPYIVTPQGSGTAELYLAGAGLEQSATLSLLRAWQDVRNWRKSLIECDPESSSDVVHTHSFASGMAGVRNLSSVVYDASACIEDLAISASLCERGSWMGRSFRVAEQFILSRAEAVIVHCQGMKSAVEERGAPQENVFLIPDPLPIHDDIPLFANNFLEERFGFDSGSVSYFVPQECNAHNVKLPQAILNVMEAFAQLSAELPQSQLLIEASPSTLAAIHGHAEQLGIRKNVFGIKANEALAVLQTATVVIATGELPDDPVQARRASQTCLHSLAMGKALLAADVPRNRDGSPDGRGCLWFAEGDLRDLAYRMAFLGRHADFRATLGAAGRAHILETRNNRTVGQQYDRAYRYAISRKKTGRPGQQTLNMLPIASVI